MTSKQLSWGRSNGFFILILVILPTSLYSMEYASSCYEKLCSYFTFKVPEINILEQETTESESPSLQETDKSTPCIKMLPDISERPRLLTEEEKKTYRFHGTTWHQMMQAYEAASWEVKHIVEHLNNPDLCNDDDYRAVIFKGPPGSGKTTTAKAIAHVANWYCKFITSSELEGIHRNETSKNLITMLNAVINDFRRKTVVVIDEAEEFFEDFESDKFDTKATGTAFRILFDKLAGNRNIFLICTMNRDTKIPQTIKNRFESDRIVFNAITDPIRKRNILKDKLEETNMKLSKGCDEKFLDECVKSLGDITPRTYQNIRKKVSRLIWNDNPKSRLIKKRHVQEAIDIIKKSREEMDIERKEETEEERQERHFVQSQFINLISQTQRDSQFSSGIPGWFSVSSGSNISTKFIQQAYDNYLTKQQKKAWDKIKKENENKS